MVRFIYSTIAALLFSFNSVAATVPFTAQAWLVADGEGKMLEGSNITDVRSIASITKLMTVMVTLDNNQPLDEVISTKLYKKNLTRRELISLAIIKSDNDAAKLLCEHHSGGLDGCIKAMNWKAWSLDMKDTHYLEPTGLSIFNVSTAQDLVKLVMAASQYSIIKEDSNRDLLTMTVGKKGKAFFHNTNTLVGKGYEFIVSKTGWITKSGGCIVMMMNTERGVRTVVLLGSKNTKTRIPEAKILALTY
jgi:D-alanyl-D-alanine endopeptidase (penicillin-binding protein 7)